MINNNTQKKNNVSVGVKTESEIYLKKSELPKNVSSFKNDAGYISQSSLETWLNNNNYISESEIRTIISDAYSVVVRQSDDGVISGINGEIVAIKDRLGNIESGITEIKDEYAKSDDIPVLTGYATEEWVESQGYLTEHQSLDGYATEQWVEGKGYLTEHQSLSAYAKKSEIPSVEGLASESWVESQGYLTEHQDISGKADKTELQNYVKTTVLRNYLKKSDMPDRNDIALVSELPTLLDDYTTKEWVEDKHYLTEHQSLSAYASKNWVINQHYLTDHQDLSEYAKLIDIPDTSNFATKSEIPQMSKYVTKGWITNQGFITADDIPEVTGYVTEEWVNNQGFLKEHQSLTGYVKKSELNGYVKESNLPNFNDFATQQWVEDKGYLTSHQSLDDYVKKSSLNSYARKTDLNEYLKESDVNTIIEGYDFLTSSDLDSTYAKKTDLPDMSKYAKSSTLSNYARIENVYSKEQTDSIFLSKESAADIYTSKSDADSKYLSKSDARKNYLQIEDYIGMKDAAVISNEFKQNTRDEFINDILPQTSVRDGLYIVDTNDLIIVKKNDPVPLIIDNYPALMWKEI